MRGFPGKYSFESLSKEAFAVRNFSRKTVYQLYEKHRAMIGDLKVEDEDLMATAYRHPSIWYNPKLLGHRSKLLERAFRLLRSVARKARNIRAEGKGEEEGFVDSDVERDDDKVRNQRGAGRRECVWLLLTSLCVQILCFEEQPLCW